MVARLLTLYFICKSGGRSAKAVEKMIAAGFTNVVSVDGGTDAWTAAGLPVERGKKAISARAPSADRRRDRSAGHGTVGIFVPPAFSEIAAFIGAAW